jgi:hypothetical protein
VGGREGPGGASESERGSERERGRRTQREELREAAALPGLRLVPKFPNSSKPCGCSDRYRCTWYGMCDVMAKRLRRAALGAAGGGTRRGEWAASEHIVWLDGCVSISKLLRAASEHIKISASETQTVSGGRALQMLARTRTAPHTTFSAKTLRPLDFCAPLKNLRTLDAPCASAPLPTFCMRARSLLPCGFLTFVLSLSLSLWKVVSCHIAYYKRGGAGLYHYSCCITR